MVDGRSDDGVKVLWHDASDKGNPGTVLNDLRLGIVDTSLLDELFPHFVEAGSCWFESERRFPGERPGLVPLLVDDSVA